MTTVVFICFICPATDLSVQSWLDDDNDVPGNGCEVLFCPACAKHHLIDRKTGTPLAKTEKRRGLH
jgi:hypothetical protein